MAALISKPGITSANMGLAIPATWNRVWFLNAISNYLKGADVRNAVGANGITVSGNITSPYATIGVAGGATLLGAGASLTNYAGSSTGTLTNAPAAGNPTKWIAINDAGTIRYLPTWL